MEQQSKTVLTFNDLFPNANVTMIKTGSELYLAYCLNKYSLKLLGIPFSIADCTIDKTLYGCSYMAYNIHTAYLTKVELPMTAEEKDKWMASQKWSSFYSGDVSYIKPISETMNNVVYSRTSESLNADMDFAKNRGTGYVHLLAYTLIQGYRDKRHKQLFIDNKNMTADRHEYSNLYILRTEGNKLITPNYCIFEYTEDKRVQPEYVAWIDAKQQHGKHDRPYTDRTKYTKTNRKFRVGDVVLVYKTRDPSKRKEFAPLTSCAIGVIRAIEPTGITIAEIAKPETKLTQIHTIDTIIAASRARGSTSMYTDIDKRSFSCLEHSYPWDTIGADDFSYNEGVFFTRVITEDGSAQWLTDGVNEQQMFLNTVDTCYAVLCDRGVKFDRERYIKQYYPVGATPVYDIWEERRRQNIANGLCKA